MHTPDMLSLLRERKDLVISLLLPSVSSSLTVSLWGEPCSPGTARLATLQAVIIIFTVLGATVVNPLR